LSGGRGAGTRAGWAGGVGVGDRTGSRGHVGIPQWAFSSLSRQGVGVGPGRRDGAVSDGQRSDGAEPKHAAANASEAIVIVEPIPTTAIQ